MTALFFVVPVTWFGTSMSHLTLRKENYDDYGDSTGNTPQARLLHTTHCEQHLLPTQDALQA